MSEEATPRYIFLDSEIERQALIQEIASIRRQVLLTVESIPEAAWYTPRYQKWSLAAFLGYINLTDNCSMLLLNLSLLGFHPALSRGVLRRMEGFTARVFRRRLIKASLTSLEKNEKRIVAFILQLPMNKFSKPVYNPYTQNITTVERAVQEFFLLQWQAHLSLIQQAEGIQPPEKSDNG